MKAGWEEFPIQEVAFIQEGPGIRKYEYEEGGFPMINVRCVQDGYIDMSSARAANMELATGKWSHFQIDEGDILFTISGTIGRCAIVGAADLPLLMNTSVVRFRSTDARLDQGYLYYFLRSDLFQAPLQRLASGTAIRNVGPTHIKTLAIPLPPLEEQQRIVTILREAFEGLDRAKANAEANLASARGLFEAALVEAFDPLVSLRAGWEARPLGQHIELISGQHIAANDYNSDGRGMPYLTGPSDFGEHSPVITKWTEHPKKKAVCGDVLLTVKGSGVGKINVLDIDAAAISRQIMAIRHAADVAPRYLHHFLSAKQRYFEQAAQGAAIPGLSREDVTSLPIPLPPLEAQQRIVEHLDEFQKHSSMLTAAYVNAKENADQLRQSLLSKAFAGELT